MKKSIYQITERINKLYQEVEDGYLLLVVKDIGRCGKMKMLAQ